MMCSILILPFLQLNRVSKEFLLNQYLTDILFIDTEFILNAARNDEFIEVILTKLSDLLHQDISQMV